MIEYRNAKRPPKIGERWLPVKVFDPVLLPHGVKHNHDERFHRP